MASVNKIKELAASHEYSLAAPILDSQDLEKSYNPQFLRVCGEIYENVGRLSEARHLYVKAHTLAPEATRIIFSLIDYYLKMGYFDLAERYFEEYVFYSSGGRDLSNVRYIMKKAKSPDLMELYDMLYPYYRDNMDEKWSFELLLLTKLLDKGDMDIIISDYKATFRTSPYLHLLDEVESDKSVAWDNFFVYAEEPKVDNNPEEEETRQMEQTQLEIDYKRINPETEDVAVITEMVSADAEDSTVVEGVEKGLKRFIKKKFKKKSEDAEKTDESEETAETDITEDSRAAEADNEALAEMADAETTGDSVEVEDVELAAPTDATEEEAETSEAEKVADEVEESFEQDFVTYELDDGFAPESDTIAGLSEIDEEFDDSSEEAFSAFRDFALFQDDIEDKVEEFVPEPEKDEIEDYIPEPEPEDEFIPEPKPEIVDEVEEEFVPEVEEDIPELEEEEEFVPEPEVKDEYVPEPEPVVEEEYIPEPEPEIVDEVEEEFEPEVEEDIPELEEEEEFVPEIEEDIPELEEEEEFVPEPEVKDEYVPEPEPVVEEEYIPEPEPEIVDEVEEEFEPEVEEDIPELEEEEEFVPEIEEDIPELEEEEEFVPDPEVKEEYVPEPEPVAEEEYIPEPEPAPAVEEPSYMKSDAPSIDFARFGSDLFPGLSKEEVKVENHFDEVAKAESEKLNEGLAEEEAKLKEAEALLASLGIKL